MTHTVRNICTCLVLWIIFIGAEKELEILKPVVCRCSVLLVIELLKCELHRLCDLVA